MVNHELFKELLEKYISGDFSTADQQLLADLLQQKEYEQTLDSLLRETLVKNTYGRSEDPERTAQFIAGLQKRIQQQDQQAQQPLSEPYTSFETPVRSKLFYLKRIAAAAVLLFVIAGSGYLFLHKKKPADTVARDERFRNDVGPGHYGALLTSSKGAQVILDSTQNGALATEGSVRLIKKNDELTYSGDTRELLYNTVSTPRGRQWRLTLSDGTKVWLDAQSSIHYPVSFQGAERIVEMTGEAYFEVAQNKAQPFIVKVGNSKIQVLGTSFNVNAYTDEDAQRMTLLQGSIRVASASATTVIQPGQQIAVREGGKMAMASTVNLDAVTAWKKDKFVFDDAPTGVVLRQLARWYDVDIRYEDNVNQDFVATISRNEPLSKVLRLLELTGGIHFRIENKTVTVMK